MTGQAPQCAKIVSEFHTGVIPLLTRCPIVGTFTLRRNGVLCLFQKAMRQKGEDGMQYTLMTRDRTQEAGSLCQKWYLHVYGCGSKLLMHCTPCMYSCAVSFRFTAIAMAVNLHLDNGHCPDDSEMAVSYTHLTLPTTPYV